MIDAAQAVHGEVSGDARLTKGASSSPDWKVSESRRSSELGSVDKVPDPQSECGDQAESEEAIGGLVVSCGQSAAVF